MLNILSCFYLLIFIASGILIANAVFREERPLIILWFGGVFGLAMLLWLPALISFLLGKFTLLSQLLALAAAVVLGAIGLRIKKPSFSLSIERRAWLPAAAAILPLFLFSVYLLSTHTIVNRDGALYVGQSTYGDLSMHLGFITSIAEQKIFPPAYSICPGTPIGYPFLSDSISSTFYQLGATLRFSTMLPAILALLLVFVGVYAFFCAWLKKKGTAVFASYLFSVGGGFGFWYFFDLAKAEPGKIRSMLTAFYETPTNFVENGLRWVNPVADMLIPQRATLFGWALLFACLYLLYRAVFKNEYCLFYPLGVLAGLLPLVHTHSFLALGVISGVYLVVVLVKRESFQKIKAFLIYGAIAVALALPQLIAFTFQQSQSFLSCHFNWANVSDSYLWFYIKNWGLLFLLLPAAFLSLSREDREVFSGPLVIWGLIELIQFQPNAYDNNKLLFVTFAFICGLVAKYLIMVYKKLSEGGILQRLGTLSLGACVAICLFLSGILTLAREAVSEYELISRQEVAAADFVCENTAPDATFLTYNNHNNAVAVLTGRNIVCGSGTFLYFHGIDYAEREKALSLLYEQPALYFDSLKQRYTIDYVYIGAGEIYNYDIDFKYFKDRFPAIYEKDGILIYDVRA